MRLETDGFQKQQISFACSIGFILMSLFLFAHAWQNVDILISSCRLWSVLLPDNTLCIYKVKYKIVLICNMEAAYTGL